MHAILSSFANHNKLPKIQPTEVEEKEQGLLFSPFYSISTKDFHNFKGLNYKMDLTSNFLHNSLQLDLYYF